MQGFDCLGTPITRTRRHVRHVMVVITEKAIDIAGGQAAQVRLTTHAHGFDDVRIEALFEGIFRQRKNGLAQMNGLANRLVSPRAQDRPT